MSDHDDREPQDRDPQSKDPQDRDKAPGPDTPPGPADPWLDGPPPPSSRPPQSPPPEANWQHAVMTRFAYAALQEQRRSRRWGIFFKSLFLAYLFLLLVIYLPRPWTGGTGGGRHTALVQIDGEIAADKPANADDLIASLQAAFRDKGTAGVIIQANSPGGSPVQAGYVNDAIYRLKKLYPHTPVYAVIGDICASGCYYIIAAADKIYADKASIVGSIGVLMNGFGFADTLKKLGVERRLITSGKNKGFMDPFSPLKPGDAAYAKQMLDEVHRQFIAVVKKGRGDRLHITPDLFSGLVWTGSQGVGLGLVDGLGSTAEVARDVIGAEKVVDYTQHPDVLQRFADRFGVAAAQAFGGLLGMEMR